MSAVAEGLFRVRGPRPDPLPVRRGFPWTAHVAWIAALAAAIGATLALRDRELGLLACGAALYAVALEAVRLRVIRVCHAVHLGAGVCVLALAHHAAAAGVFALPAGLALAADLGARAGAVRYRGSVAPLAGQVPPRFRRRYRDVAILFGAGGLVAGVVLILAGPSTPVRIVGVALVPLALRSFATNLLSYHASKSLWILAACVHVAILAAFVPQHGAVAAAWALVGAETVLFVGASLVILRVWEKTPFPTAQMAGMAAAGILLCAVSVPGNAAWPLLVVLLFGAACGALLYPTRR